MAKTDVQDLSWYKRPLWLASLAALVFSVSFAVFAARTVVNGQTLDRLDESQKSLDELTTFVHRVDGSDRPSGQDPEDPVIRRFVDLLCSTEDQVTLAKCEELGLLPTEG